MRRIKVGTCRGRRVSLGSGDNFFTQKKIDEFTQEHAYQTKGVAEYLRKISYDLENLAHNLKDYIKKRTIYLADKGIENLLSPACLMKNKYGDCKSMTVFASATLRQLKIPHAIRIVKINKKYFSHVYVAEIGGYSGLVVDATVPFYNEPTYREKRDLWVKKF